MTYLNMVSFRSGPTETIVIGIFNSFSKKTNIFFLSFVEAGLYYSFFVNLQTIPQIQYRQVPNFYRLNQKEDDE